MKSSSILSSLSTLDVELESAQQALNQLAADATDSKYDGPLYEDPKEAVGYILRRVYELLLVILEAAEMPENRRDLCSHWKHFEEQAGGISATHYDPVFDYMDSKPFAYLKTLVDGLRVSTGESLKPAEAYELAKLETLLRKAPVLLKNRGIKPTSEPEIQATMNDYLSAFFTEFRPSPKITGVLKDFKPDCGIRNLKAAIEFKYANTKEEVVRALSGIFEDVSGYKGSHDWTRFYSVIYQTEAFESEDRVSADLKRAGALVWTPLLVTGGGTRRRKRVRVKRRNR